MLAATRPGSWIDHLCRVLVTAGVSLPTFFTGLLLVYVFYYLLGWAPSPLGRLDVFFLPPPNRHRLLHRSTPDRRRHGDGLGAALRQLVLPARHAGAVRAGADRPHDPRPPCCSVLASDYVRTARASGLSRAHGDRHLRASATPCCR